jgi:hypothetical protein
MVRTLAALALLALAPLAAAQSPDATPGRFVVIGCISQENAGRGAGAPGSTNAPYLLTDGRRTPPAVYRLDGDPKQLSMLVGQTVEVTGPISPGANKQPPALKVATLIRIATTCAKTGK